MHANYSFDTYTIFVTFHVWLICLVLGVRSLMLSFNKYQISCNLSINACAFRIYKFSFVYFSFEITSCRTWIWVKLLFSDGYECMCVSSYFFFSLLLYIQWIDSIRFIFAFSFDGFASFFVLALFLSLKRTTNTHFQFKKENEMKRKLFIENWRKLREKTIEIGLFDCMPIGIEFLECAHELNLRISTTKHFIFFVGFLLFFSTLPWIIINKLRRYTSTWSLSLFLLTLSKAQHINNQTISSCCLAFFSMYYEILENFDEIFIHWIYSKETTKLNCFFCGCFRNRNAFFFLLLFRIREKTSTQSITDFRIVCIRCRRRRHS